MRKAALRSGLFSVTMKRPVHERANPLSLIQRLKNYWEARRYRIRRSIKRAIGYPGRLRFRLKLKYWAWLYADYKRPPSPSPLVPLIEAIDRFVAETQEPATLAQIPASNRDALRTECANYMAMFMPFYAIAGTSQKLEELSLVFMQQYRFEIRDGVVLLFTKGSAPEVLYDAFQVRRVLLDDLIDVSRPAEKPGTLH